MQNLYKLLGPLSVFLCLFTVEELPRVALHHLILPSTSNKKLLVAPGITTRNKRTLLGTPSIATSE